MSDVPPAFDEVRIFIDPDGTVTICDLWEELLPVAEALGDVAPACPVASGPAGPTAPEEDGPPRLERGARAAGVGTATPARR